MGYTTEFMGKFEFDSPIDDKLKTYINNFAESRRMIRDVEKIKEVYPDWEDYSFNGELGVEGEYFARPGSCFGQDRDDSIIDFNDAPSTQPGLWCQWVVSEDGKYLEWDGGEKFYYYTEWLKYLIENFFKPTGNVLNGSVEWQGEELDDFGKIEVENNVITVYEGHKPYKKVFTNQN